MSLCQKCGTSWTSLGTTMCPICGSKAGDGQDRPQAAFSELKESGVSENGTVRSSGRAVQTAQSQLSSSPAPSAAASVSAPPKAKESRPLPPLKVTVFPRAERQGPAASPHSQEPAAKSPEVTIAVPLWLKKPSPELSDLPSTNVGNRAPVPSAPGDSFYSPLILGALGLITGVLLPVTLLYESSRILGVLGFCMSAFFVPFAPIAWIAGLSAEQRQREQGSHPERRVVTGRLLGQGATMLLLAEVAAVLIMIAVFRLSGHLPPTFGLHSY